ncbi:betaine-aldehyde dehydrogenase [Novosphingobium decolorationis]|uniref:HTH-type transcriptional regulator BetI n=1 Tax=Novosphingobium decolorationis TaxID=2698673 RepID=A0ABX8E6Z3_9SPHN|nr:betaine-aldehyde dehydrogenase [Novosphingobium decolorationis]QVM84794.1 betaine-aldehyde dehydrogenase [Novosphingobium decolorationis]
MATGSATTKAPSRHDARARQLIEMTIDSLAEVGFTGTTLAEIGKRADVSPGLVAHYFKDKNGLLEAAFRALAFRHGDAVRLRMIAADSPRARVQAVIDASLSRTEIDLRTSMAWLAFWGQALQHPRLHRVQRAYQKRMLSNLTHALRAMETPEEARKTAALIAAMIDGVWLRGALSSWNEVDPEAAREMLNFVVEDSLARHPIAAASVPATVRPVNPATGETIADLPVATAEDIDRMVAKAQEGQREWAALSGTERGRVLRRTSDILRERNDALAEIETRNTGKPVQETKAVDIISGADCLEYYGGIASTVAGQFLDLGAAAFGYTRREPLGVCAGIGAWNYPMQIACWKAAPALACGNALIFKPAEQTPMTAMELEGIFREAGLPEGVFQVAQGYGETGRSLIAHPGIAKVSLTGSVPTGRLVMGEAAKGLKPTTLELGGKSPLIVFEDADLDNAVSGAMMANFYSTGQICSNGTRVFVHRSVLKDFLARLEKRTKALRIGDPFNPETHLGPLVSATQLDLVLGHIAGARREGVKLLMGGERLTGGEYDRGFYVEPTVFQAEDDSASIVRDEVFGPVMLVLPFDTEEEVIARANDTEFGLAAGVFTRDLMRAHTVIAALQAGSCWINDYNVTPIELPFGGYKNSGVGRENGLAAIEHYTQLKSVYVAKGDVDAPY